MKLSLRLTTLALGVLALLLLAAAVQATSRLTGIRGIDRARDTVALVARLRPLDTALAVASADPDAPGAIPGVQAAIRGVDALTPTGELQAELGPRWPAFRAAWRRARTPADADALAASSEYAVREAYLNVLGASLASGSIASLDAPVGEAALLALPVAATQEQRMTAYLRRGSWPGAPGGDPVIAMTQHLARAELATEVGFMALASADPARHAPPGFHAQANAAADASETFLQAVEQAVLAGRLVRDRFALVGLGEAASRRLVDFEATVLPLVDERLAHARAMQVREITLIALLVAAVVGVIGLLALQALGSQSRSRLSREALEHQARHDSLTGLPNRRAFSEAIATVVQAWTPINDRTAWILSIDLDYFKEVNDRYGHQTGDEFLVAAAQRLREAASESDLVARVGGDEFAVLVRHYDPYSAQPVEVAQRICESFEEPIVVEGVRHRLAASIGIVAVDALHETVDSLLRDADIAMYRAKEDGGGRVVVFDDSLRQEIVHRAELAADLPAAMARGDIGVVFQPVVSLDGGTCHGFEALVRWRHPTYGPVDASLLIDVAQESRLIDDLGRHIVHEVCRHMADWRAAGLDLSTLSVHFNVSPMEAVHAETFGSIAHALEMYGIPPHSLVVELTETASMESVEAANRFLTILHAIDVRICLDDFGTGYSSLKHLNDFVVDSIKIDRSFVASAASNPDKIPLLAGIIALAQGLNAEIIAEGIETIEQRSVVEALGCRLVQGYLYARPMAPAAALEFAREAATVG